MAPHILILDDQISLTRFIAIELDAAGYQVSTNCDGVAELSVIQNLAPDLIVLNWELRSASGLNICRQLRASNNQVPIVVVTAKDETSYQAALEAGAQTCLTKPFSINALLKEIEHHLRLPAK